MSGPSYLRFTMPYTYWDGTSESWHMDTMGCNYGHQSTHLFTVAEWMASVGMYVPTHEVGMHYSPPLSPVTTSYGGKQTIASSALSVPLSRQTETARVTGF